MRHRFAALLALLMTTGGWGTAASSDQPEIKSYEVRGILQNLDPQQNQATIAHGAIPGYMPAMTMSFPVRDYAQLPQLQPGDVISFRLNVTLNNDWIDQVKKTGAPSSAGSLFTPAPVSPGRELKEGDLMPTITLVNGQGQKIDLKTFRGKVLAVTFIYTRCPLPTYCPLINRNFAATQELMTRLDAAGNWTLLSLSLDPDFDTPGVLAAEADAYHADPRHWIFATGNQDDIRRFGGAIGLEFKITDNQINHNLRTVVIDDKGHIRHIFRGNNWTPQELTSEIRAALPRH